MVQFWFCDRFSQRVVGILESFLDIIKKVIDDCSVYWLIVIKPLIESASGVE